MKQILIIQGRLPGLNDIIKKANNHFHDYATMKREYMNLVAWECKRQNIKPVSRTNIKITWHCKDRRRNKDNIIGGGTKIILDALQVAGVIKNDGWKEIGDFTHVFTVEEKEKIEVEIEEIGR